MNKAAWLASLDGPQMLLRVPRQQFTRRKHLLFACGCLRSNLRTDPNPPSFIGPGAGSGWCWI